MTDDPLNKERTLAVELSESGVAAKSNLRAVNGFDRLLGNVSELLNIRMEKSIVRARATMEGEKKLIDATAALAVQKLGTDDEFASRAISSLFAGAARKQVNKDGVVAAAIEDLTTNPPSPEQANQGPEQLSEEFLSKFEGYAEEATTEELRERWGRIFAAEVRKPGTFNNKVLRITDEIDVQIASTFEDLCRRRIGEMIPYQVGMSLQYMKRQSLVEAGLLVDPGIGGQLKSFRKTELNDGYPVWFHPLGTHAIAYDQKREISGLSDESNLAENEGALALRCLILTQAGTAIASILDHDPITAETALIEVLKGSRDNDGLRVFKLDGPLFRQVYGDPFVRAP